MHARLVSPWFTLALAAAPATQSLWIVDADNRPSTHFTDIPLAVSAAAAGDWIFVRYPVANNQQPHYTAPNITQGLTLVGEELSNQRPTLFGTLTVSNVPAGQSVTIASLRSGATFGPTTAGITATNVAGQLLLANLVVQSPSVYFQTPPTVPIRFVDCDDVVIHRCELSSAAPGNEIVRSFVRFGDSWLTSVASSLFTWGGPATGVIPGGAGLDLQDSTVVLARTSVRASARSSTSCYFSGCTTVSVPGDTAVILDATSRVVAGAACHLEGPRHSVLMPVNQYTVTYSPAVSGTGALITDPRCTILGNTPTQHVVATVHQTRIDLARLGEVPLVSVASEPSSFALIAASFRASTPLPTALGNVWLDPASTFVLGFVQLDGQGDAALPLPMTGNVVIGRQLAAQSAILLPSSALVLSEPAFTTNLPPSQ